MSLNVTLTTAYLIQFLFPILQINGIDAKSNESMPLKTVKRNQKMTMYK